MPSVKSVILATLASLATAIPTGNELHRRMEISRRQNAAAAALGINDNDILQFALTLEWLEGEFYNQSRTAIPDADMLALGLTPEQVASIRTIGDTEFSHVTFLSSALATGGVKPVQPCIYNFGFTDALSFLQTAATLENVGVAAYLGAASLVDNPTILTAAGGILTVEARHQTFIRAVSGKEGIPQSCDTPLSPGAVFSLAAPFIQSCPDGSNLIFTPFPTLTMAAPGPVAAGSTIQLQSEASANARFCAFTNCDYKAGGTVFTAFDPANGCEVPNPQGGISYLTLTSDNPVSGIITDDIIVAGVVPLEFS